MKFITLVLSISLCNTAFSDLKETLMNAAKDKENQEKVKEIAKKSIEYIKGQNKEEAKPEVAPAPAPAPEKVANTDKKKKKAKKKK